MGISVFNLTSLAEFKTQVPVGMEPPFLMNSVDVGNQFLLGRANLRIVPASYMSNRGLCLVVISSSGLEVICNPQNASQMSRHVGSMRGGGPVRNATNLAVKGQRAFVLTNDEQRVWLLTFDLGPLDANSDPVLLDSLCIASECPGECLIDGAPFSDASFSLAASSDGSKVFASITPFMRRSADTFENATVFQ